MKYGKGLKVLALYGFSTWLWGAEQTEVALPVDPLCLSCGSISVSPTSVSNATVELSPTSASSATVELSPTSASSVTVELSPASASSATLQPIVEEQSSELPGLLTPIPELPNTHTGFLSGKGLAGGVDNIMILEEIEGGVNPDLGSLAALFLESYPVGAKVYIDDEEVGVTPYQHLHLTAGQVLDLRLSHLLYHDKSWSLTLKSGSNEPGVVRLNPAFGRLVLPPSLMGRLFGWMVSKWVLRLIVVTMCLRGVIVWFCAKNGMP